MYTQVSEPMALERAAFGISGKKTPSSHPLCGSINCRLDAWEAGNIRALLGEEDWAWGLRKHSLDFNSDPHCSTWLHWLLH
jgi:hypothetical protein